jgi:hypothetical protein
VCSSSARVVAAPWRSPEPGTHLTNFTAGHETRSQLIGEQRFAYPDQHVEADNRLSWFLGGLAQRFGDEPLYVHLRRDPEAVAQSLARRWSSKVPGILIRAFGTSIVMRGNGWPAEQRLEVCRFYVETITATSRRSLSTDRAR